MPPRPSSSHSQQGIPQQTQQGQQQQPPQQINQGSNQGLQMEGPPGHMQGYPPHMQQMGAYKQMGPYPPQSQYSPQYAPRGQFPGYPGNQQGSPYNPGQSRPMHNHVGSQQAPPQGPPPHQGGYPPHQGQHAGYPGPQNIWPPPQNNPAAGVNHLPGGKNIGPPHSQSPQPQQQQQAPPGVQQQQQPGPNSQQQQPGGSPRQLNYLKQHLQHKGGYAQGTTPPPQNYGNGPAMGPPMGPPMPPSAMGPPPHGAVPPQHMENASGMNQMPPNVHHEGMPPQESVNNGMPPSIPHHQVTSIVTTGPDGTQLDEASQQSTLSNTSIGETIFSNKNEQKRRIYSHSKACHIFRYRSLLSLKMSE